MHVRIALPVLAAVGALLACGPAASDSTALQAASAAIGAAAVAPGNAGGNKTVTVMDQNLYVGTDVGVFLSAPPELLPVLAAQAWAMVQLTDFPERAEAIADEIAATRPVAIGLQEAALWRTESPPDAYLGAPPDAQDVAYDFLAILLAALADRGLSYDLAAVVENADLELTVPVSLEPLELLDVRITDRDAILVRRDVQWSNASAEHFDATVPIVIGDPAAPILAFDYLRGWTGVDVKYEGEWFRFLNTHLEAFEPNVRLAQAGEFVDLVEASPLPVVAVGDFNAQPGSAPYVELTSVLADAWVESGAEGPGYTCCSNDPLLRDTAAPPFDERIDLVLFTAPFVPLDATVVGEETTDLTATGMWPSDHAGVVAKLRYVEPRFYALQP
jgi:hypothetical protein